MVICKAEIKDLEEILRLQYLAYQSEAELLNDCNIQPLTQTLEELIAEFKRGVIYKAVDENGRIIGSVRGYVQDGTLHIGKLMVHPGFQGRGIGTSLLKTIENEYKPLRKELFTSSQSLRNLRLYEKCGYSRFKQEAMSDNYSFVYLEKLPD